MTSLFKKPKAQVMPKPEAPKPLPRVDDEMARKERLKQYAELQKRSGRESTRLGDSDEGEEALGDVAMTRGAAILGG